MDQDVQRQRDTKGVSCLGTIARFPSHTRRSPASLLALPLSLGSKENFASTGHKIGEHKIQTTCSVHFFLIIVAGSGKSPE
uniref:Uncharacterized protein n=1 Tax=Zea mays TaxID=4577 RepID=A0A804PSI7_MAIZE